MKIKIGNEFDEKALDVEYDEGEYSEYEGSIPPRGTILRGRIKKLWYCISSNDNPMFKVLWEAEGNEDDFAEYNGLGVWDNVTFTPKAAFRYGPFLKLFGLKLADIKLRMQGEEEDNVGVPVSKISKWEPGSDAALCRIVVKRERYEGEVTARVGRYLPPADDDEDDRPAKGKKGGKAAKPAKPAKGKKGGKSKGDEDPF